MVTINCIFKHVLKTVKHLAIAGKTFTQGGLLPDLVLSRGAHRARQQVPGESVVRSGPTLVIRHSAGICHTPGGLSRLGIDRFRTCSTGPLGASTLFFSPVSRAH